MENKLDLEDKICLSRLIFFDLFLWSIAFLLLSLFCVSSLTVLEAVRIGLWIVILSNLLISVWNLCKVAMIDKD
jgi:hypothetical protein